MRLQRYTPRAFGARFYAFRIFSADCWQPYRQVNLASPLNNLSQAAHTRLIFGFRSFSFIWFPHFLFTAENTEKSQHTSFKGDATNDGASVACSNIRGVVVNFDLGERFPRPRSQQRGSLHPRVRCVVAGGGHPPAPGNFFEIFDTKSSIWGQFGPENKLIEGQPYEYNVKCRNASVWPTIFAGAPFWLQNICRNGVPPRSRTTTPLSNIRL